MPVKDPERRRQIARDSMRRSRARRRAGLLPIPSLPNLPEPPAAAEPGAPKPPAGDPVAWIEQVLLVPSGPLRGRPFRLGEWQRRFIAESMAPGVREAALCVARKNGKTGLVAAIVLAHLAGPWNRPDWRGLVASLNADLAIELRNAVTMMAELSGVGVTLVKSPRPGMLYGLQGASCQFLATDRGTGHAKGADLAIIDEAGLMPESQRAVWNAMLSSTSGRDGRLMCISILGDGPMMADLRERRGDTAVCWHGYTTTMTEDPTSRATWAKANPGLQDGIKSEQYMADMARRAAASPADMAAFRAYDLNAPGAPDRLLLVTMAQWESAKAEPGPRGGPCTLGVDLGGSASMTAAAAYWWETGRMEVWCAFPGVPDLRARALADSVGNRYERMAEAGELWVYPGVRTTPVKLFLTDVLNALQGEEVAAIVADRYRQSEAQDVYAAADVRAPAVWRGQGWADASHDVRAFQRAVIGGKLRVGEHLAMESAIAESALAIDPAGNAKLDKARARGRIDCASAAVLATGEAERRAAAPASGGYWGIA